MSEPPSITRAPTWVRTDGGARLVVLAGVISVLVLGVPILMAGYGADVDSFLMLGTWDLLLSDGRYVPS